MYRWQEWNLMRDIFVCIVYASCCIETIINSWLCLKETTDSNFLRTVKTFDVCCLRLWIESKNPLKYLNFLRIVSKNTIRHAKTSLAIEWTTIFFGAKARWLVLEAKLIPNYGYQTPRFFCLKTLWLLLFRLIRTA